MTPNIFNITASHHSETSSPTSPKSRFTPPSLPPKKSKTPIFNTLLHKLLCNKDHKNKKPADIKLHIPPPAVSEINQITALPAIPEDVKRAWAEEEEERMRVLEELSRTPRKLTKRRRV